MDDEELEESKILLDIDDDIEEDSEENIEEDLSVMEGRISRIRYVSI